MRARYYCPDCLTAREHVSGDSGPFACGGCGRAYEGDLGRVMGPKGVERCAFCDNRAFFLQKDFDQRLGCLIMAVSLGIALFVGWKFGWIWFTPVLLATVVVDWVVAARIRPVTICYRCDAEYRDIPVNRRAQGLRSARRGAVRRAENGAADAMTKIYDISRLISEETPVWPGDVAFSWRETARAGAGAGAPWGSTCFTMSAHCGTHADAPSHLFEDGKAIGEAPLAAYVGPARVLALPGIGEVGPDALPRRCLGPSRVLFRSLAKASLSPLAAIRLADAGAMLVGTDGASIDPEDAEDLPAHRALLSRGVALLEDLDLSAVPDGDYELVALPLRFRDLDASPVRAILIRT